jgi:hypothetical protein
VVETSSYSKANMSKQRRHICHAADTPVTLHNKHNTDSTGVRVWHSKAALKHKQNRRVTETPSIESTGRIHVATVSGPDKRSRHRGTRSRNPLLRTWRYYTTQFQLLGGRAVRSPVPCRVSPRERRGGGGGCEVLGDIELN